MSLEHQVKIGDRILAVTESGDLAGTPVFLLHGTPGSRVGPKPRIGVLYQLGVRLITYDRPGYGGSARAEHRTVAGAAADIGAIADHLDLNQPFAVVGRSGGGPHALACAALLGDRVSRCAALVSVAPPNAPGLDWYDGMVDENVQSYTVADADTLRLIEEVRLRADRTRADPGNLMNALRTQMTHADLAVTNDVALRRLLHDTYAEALRSGPYGWIDDVFAFRRPWEFEFSQIGVPVLLWHGANDNFSPVSHTRWLAQQMPHAEVQIQSGTAHFGAMSILPQTLTWLTDGPAVRQPVPAPAPSERVRLHDPVQIPAFV